MKNLKELIIEKLKIDKNTKLKRNYKPNEILNWLGITEESCERWYILIDEVKKWLTDINGNKLELCADKETVNDFPLPKEIKELINTDYKINEECQYELNRAHKVYSNGDIELHKSKYMICNITQYGTLYVINKTQILNKLNI